MDLAGLELQGVSIGGAGATGALIGDTIITSGAESEGILAEARGVATLGGANGVTTTGDDSIGLRALSGGVIDATGPVTITTGSTSAGTGLNAHGVNADGAGSEINLAATTVTTFGSSAYGLYASDGGVVDVAGVSSIATHGTGATGVYASGAGSSIAVVGGATIATAGASAAGLQADTGGLVTLNGGSVTTTGIGAPGLSVDGAGSKIMASNVAVATNGGYDLSTQSFSFGLVASNGGSATVSGGSITTNAPVAHGVFAFNGGSVALSAGTTVLTTGGGSFGLFVNGAGSSLTATDVSVTTDGGVGPAFGDAAIGAYNGFASPGDPTGGAMTLTETTLTTSGTAAVGVETNSGGATNISGGAVATSGQDAHALFVTGAGSRVNLGGATTFATQGDGAIGLYALAGGVINATGAVTVATTGGVSVTTTGLPAYGVNADGAGSQINLAGATKVTTAGANAFGLYASAGGTVTASGGPSVTTSGLGAIGLYASGAGSSVTAGGDATILTQGAMAPAAQADNGGLVTLNGASLTTSGNDSHALEVSGTGSRASLGGANSFSTSRLGSIGLYALGGGVIDALGQTTITTMGSVSASTGLSAYGVNADGAGSQVNLGAAKITTTGAGAAGLYASDITGSGHGGAIAVSGPLGIVTGGLSAYGAWAQGAGSTIALDGPTTIALSGDKSAGLMAAAGGLISTQGSTSIAVSGAGSIGVQALSGMVTASGALNVTTSQATAAAFALSGASPSIIASGGGTVSAAGNTIAFTNATNAVATFDNFNIKNTAGDLILADPSSATINFHNTVANAGAGNLLNATAGSTVAFNASASTLTGAIQTDPTSLTNVSLANGTNWTMSASSTATSLNLANSAIVFAPSGGFKTLTLGSYVGSGANITLNTALGGPNAGSTDQLIINGGAATGLTSLTIKNASGAAGAATTGAGIPVVAVSNGGTTSSNAFYLANGAPILAGGYEYTLGRASNQDWYLTSSPAASMSQIQSSVTSLAQAQLKQLVTSRVLGSLLLGANEQVNGCSCGGGFASIGSFSLGSHGRWALNDSVTLLAGAAFESYYQDGANVRAAPIVAASLRYDPPNWGKSRPFFEVGAALSPYIDTTYTRYYTNGLTPAQGVGSAVDRSVSVFGRIGWVDRLTPIDEAAVFADLVRGWQQSGGYTEAASAVNPFPATVSTGVDRQDVVRFGAQYTRLLFGNIEGNINGAIAYGFDNEFGSRVNVTSFGSVAPYPLLNSAWTEFGGRLAYRFSRNLVVDAFLIGTLGGEIGPTLHGGLGVRYAF